MAKENQIAKVDNKLIEAFFKKSSISAFKVLLYIGKTELNKKVKIEDLDNNKLYKVPLILRKISEYYDLDARTIKDSIALLNETSINYRRISEDGKDVQTFINLLPKAEINYTNETLDCYVFGEVIKLVYAITTYSSVNVKNFIKLKSKHSGRVLLLLERISQYKKLDSNGIDIMPKRQHYELDELNKMFGTKYKSYNQFIRAVFIPAKEELDAHSTISFEYKAIKDRVGEKARSRGRTPITSITIDVVENAPRLF